MNRKILDKFNNIMRDINIINKINIMNKIKCNNNSIKIIFIVNLILKIN